MGLDVVAEGIERDGQREALAGLGCPHGQGFLFSKPSADLATVVPQHVPSHPKRPRATQARQGMARSPTAGSTGPVALVAGQRPHDIGMASRLVLGCLISGHECRRAALSPGGFTNGGYGPEATDTVMSLR